MMYVTGDWSGGIPRSNGDDWCHKFWVVRTVYGFLYVFTWFDLLVERQTNKFHKNSLKQKENTTNFVTLFALYKRIQHT